MDETFEQQLADLTLAKSRAEFLKSKYEADTAGQQMLAAKAHADAAIFGLERGKRPSSLVGPLLVFYDDVGSRWAVAYGTAGEQLVAMLPSHITETGVTAYGASPEEAMINFDKIWRGEE